MHMGHVNEWLRTKATIFLAVICAILMCVWLIPWQQLIREQRTSSGKLFGKEIDGNEVYGVYLTLDMSQRQMQNADVPHDALMATAWETIMYREASAQYGISVADADVARIAKAQMGVAADTPEGDQIVAERLANSGLTRKQYDAAVKALVLSAKLQNAVKTSVTMPAGEAWLWYSREHQKLKVQYIELTAALLDPLVTVDDKQVRAFYEKHKDQLPQESDDQIGYLTQEKVQIEYILVPTAPYADKAVVTQRQIEEYYESHKQQYKLPAAAEETDKPAELRYQPLSEVAASIEMTLRRDEAKRAAEEQIREIRLEAQKQAEVPWASHEVRTVDFPALAEKYGAKYTLTRFFSADECYSILPGASALAGKAFGQSASAKGAPSSAMSAADGEFIFKVKDEQRSVPEAFEQIAEQVKKDCRRQKALDVATEIAAKARAAGSFAAAEEALKTELRGLIAQAPAPAAGKELEKDPTKYYVKGDTGFFPRPMQFNGRRYPMGSVGLKTPGLHMQFIDAAFTLRKDEVAVADESREAGAVYLLTPLEEQAASREEFVKNNRMFEQMLLSRKSEATLASWAAELLRRAKPSKNVMDSLRKLPQWTQLET